MTTSTPVLYISPGKIVVNGEDPAYGWNLNNLEDILLQIKSKINSKTVRILLDDSTCYLVNFSLSLDKKTNRIKILQDIQNQIPEKIENGFWDYKIDQFDKTNHVQAFVVKHDFMESLVKGLTNADIHVEASEPVCLAIARLTKQESGAHILIYSFAKDESKSFVLANHGQVLSVVVTGEEATENQIKRFIAFCKQRYQLRPNTLLIDKSILLDSKQIESIPVGKIDLDPFKGILRKKDITGPDDKTLNLDSEKFPKPGDSKTKKIPLIVPAGLIAALIGFIGFLVLSPADPDPKPTPTPVSFTTPAPLVNLNNYKFQILNGTGVAGEAANIRNLLSIDTADLANASSYDYEFTEVKLKPNLPDEIFNKISEQLNETYNVKRSAQDLTEDSEFDVVIITGVKK